MKPQKALHMFQESDKKNPKYIGHEYNIFKKHDGWYGYMDGCEFICSRQGRPIPSLLEFGKDIQNVFSGRLIFEILIEGVPDFHIMNGILNRTIGDCSAKGVYLMVHDYIPLEGVDTVFADRYAMASAIVRELDHPSIRTSPILATSNSKQVWEAVASEVLMNGGEGVVLKRVDAPYSPDKRNYDLMKIKEEVTADLIVVGMTEGEGKYVGTLGALILEDKDFGRHSVSGMTDQQRDEWWANPEEIKGRVVEIKAMKRLADGTYREPRFKAIRYDKTYKDID